MSIHRNVKQSLVEYINSANSSPLTAAELDFGLPQPIAGTWREGLVDRNTAIKITAKEASNFKGARVICYDRLNLNDFHKLVPLSVKAYYPETTHDLLKPILLRYGIFFEASEFLDEPLPEIGVEPIYVTLKAKTDSIGWIGQLDVQVAQGNAVLADHLTTTQLPGINYPVPGNGAQGSALTYLYGYDFTSFKGTLENYEEGQIITVDDTDLLTAIQTTDTNTGKALWNLTPGATTWALEGAEVVYSGINSPLLPTNPSYKYVLGIKLRDDVTTPPGVFYLHYDDSFDPDAV